VNGGAGFPSAHLLGPGRSGSHPGDGRLGPLQLAMQILDAELDLALFRLEPGQFGTQLFRAADPGESEGVDSSSHRQEPKFMISLAVDTGMSTRIRPMSCVENIPNRRV